MRSARPLMSPAALSFRASPKPVHRRALISSASTFAGVTAAATAAAQSQTDIDFGGDGSGIIIGQTLLGAVHSHQSGLTHSHNPLTQSPIGPNHAHSFPTTAGTGTPGEVLIPGPFAAAPAPVPAPGLMPAAAEAVPQPTPVTMPAPVSVALPVPLSVPAPVSMSAAGEPILISGSAPALLTSSASALASVSTSYASATPPPISGVGVDHGLLALSLGGLAGLAAALATLPAQASGGQVDTGGSGGGIGYSTQGARTTASPPTPTPRDFPAAIWSTSKRAVPAYSPPFQPSIRSRTPSALRSAAARTPSALLTMNTAVNSATPAQPRPCPAIRPQAARTSRPSRVTLTAPTLCMVTTACNSNSPPPIARAIARCSNSSSPCRTTSATTRCSATGRRTTWRV